jgi:hypothetical protein
MAPLYADENFPGPVIRHLRTPGHDVLTAHEDGRGNQKVPDADVLARATALGRAVLTNDRNDFHRLHAADPKHGGIITCTRDPDYAALAGRIHAALETLPTLAGQLLKIVRPNTPAKSAMTAIDIVGHSLSLPTAANDIPQRVDFLAQDA